VVERKSDNISRAERNRKAYGLVFAGFERPTYTAIPNELYVPMPLLSAAELKVVLYVARRTFGFKRGSDRISASQFERGIVGRDGRLLDLMARGCHGEWFTWHWMVSHKQGHTPSAAT
jgi:hypothetical protein